MGKIKGFKTALFGAALIALAAFADEQAKAFIMEHFGWSAGGVGTAVIILRAITNSPMFKKES